MRILKSKIIPRVTAALSGLLLLIGAGAVASAQEEPSSGITDLSETETSYAGARLLSNTENVRLGELRSGRHDDQEERERYLFWQGDSLFLGVIDTEDDNRLDVVAEFYWFESSLPRNSDFYVIVLKVTAAPAANTNWRIATPASVFDSALFRDIGAVQRVEASMDRGGVNGAIRWDWSVPFQNYRWEPERVIEIEQEYAAGANIEGSAMRDLSGGVNVQAKGFLNAETRVSTRYTITLWRWEMLVQAGATDMDWALIALSPEHEQDPAYHEYFLVLQAERGVPVRIDHLQFATTMRKRNPLFFDDFKNLSVRLRNIELSAPNNPCGEGFNFEDGACVEECPEDYERDGERCILVCPEGYIPQDDACAEICPEGYEYVDGECSLSCPPDSIEVDGVCEHVCPDGSLSSNGECALITCPEGERLEDGECRSICATEEYWSEGQCVMRCPEGSRYEGETCVSICDEGERYDGATCVSICDEDERYDGAMCVPLCAEGTRYIDGRCETDEPCAEGSTLQDGACVSICPAGYSYINGQCQSVCPDGTTFEDGRCYLPCPEGSELVEGACVAQGCSAGEECDLEAPKVTSPAEEGCATRHSRPISLWLLLVVLAALRARRLA